MDVVGNADAIRAQLAESLEVDWTRTVSPSRVRVWVQDETILVEQDITPRGWAQALWAVFVVVTAGGALLLYIPIQISRWIYRQKVKVRVVPSLAGHAEIEVEGTAPWADRIRTTLAEHFGVGPKRIEW